MIPRPNAAIPTRRRTPSRRWLWAGLFALAAALTLWGAWTLGLGLWAEASGLHSDFDVTVNGQPWSGDAPGSWLGAAIAVAVVALLVLVALTVLLPMALGAVLLVGLLLVCGVAGVVVGAVALPVLLVLALLLSPLLALAGLGWMLFA